MSKNVGENANNVSLWLKVSYDVEDQIKKICKKSKIGVSEYLRRIVIAHLNETAKPLKPQKLETPAETLLLTLKTTYGANTPCLYKGKHLILKDLGQRLGVSLIYILNRLKQGDSLERIVHDIETKGKNQ